MKRITEGLYNGTVVHTRLRPIRHRLSYRVFSVLFDCERLDELEKRLFFFSRNRFNLFSLYDRDHGDGSPPGDYLKGIAARSGQGEAITRFVMLCYPRILGYAFNPLTVFFGLDADDGVRLVVYEVRNTFGERQSYVLPVERQGGGVITQSCRKRLYVSPFNGDNGKYTFHVTPPGDGLTVGVALSDASGPLMKAHFRGTRSDLSDRTLISALARTGWMTVKVTAAIHFEAAKLWLKGLKPVARPTHAKTAISFIKDPREV